MPISDLSNAFDQCKKCFRSKNCYLELMERRKDNFYTADLSINPDQKDVCFYSELSFCLGRDARFLCSPRTEPPIYILLPAIFFAYVRLPWFSRNIRLGKNHPPVPPFLGRNVYDFRRRRFSSRRFEWYNKANFEKNVDTSHCLLTTEMLLPLLFHSSIFFNYISLSFFLLMRMNNHFL